jgi:hypothetical protein
MRSSRVVIFTADGQVVMDEMMELKKGKGSHVVR